MAHIWQREPEPITEFCAELSADVIVIGAGAAGTTAAQSAAEAGASVICVEKFACPTAHGTDIGSVNTKVHAREGVYIPPAEAARLEYAWSQQQANYHLIRTYIDRSADLYRMMGDTTERARVSLVNIAQSGIFAADRAVQEYADNIWHI